MNVLTAHAPSDARPWRPALAVLLALIAGMLLVGRETATTMVGIWSRSETFTHGFLVPPISLWLVWRRRSEIARLVPRPDPWMLLPLAAVAFVWLLGDALAVNAVAQFALVAMLVLAVPVVLGRAVAGAVLFPLLFLFFAVPFGEFMLPRMMEWTADFTVAALRLSGIAVYREGLQFVIPSGAWSVVEACSGVRYLIASFMVGTLFAYINYSSPWRRAVFMGVSLLVPVLANWLRAYMIVMIGHLSNNRLAVGVDHLIYGWVFFGVVITIMFMIGARWAEPEAEVVPASAAAEAALAPPVSTVALVVTALLAMAVVALPLAAGQSLRRPDGPGRVVRLELPESMSPGWSRAAAMVPDWKPVATGPSTEVDAVYGDGRRRVGLHLAYYADQNVQRKLVSSENVLVKSNDRVWNQVSAGRREVTLGDRRVSVQTAELLAEPTSPGAPRPQRVAWRFYWVDDHAVGGDIPARLDGALARLLGRSDDGAVVVLYADEGGAAASHAAIEAFATEHFAALRALLQRAAAAR